jgi:glycosyltransferase involved in cell wall biosynthesis
VDDGSTDDTVLEALAAGAEVVSHEENRGLGAAIRTGIGAAVADGCEVVAFCDGDGEYGPEELDLLVGPILDGSADYVVGSRFAGTIRHMRAHRRLGNIVLTRWVRWMVRRPVTDGQSGYRALSRDAAAQAGVIHDYNYAQVLTLNLLGQGFRYAEVPITYRFRTSGRSFVRLLPYLRRVVPAAIHEIRRQSSTT